MFTISWGDRYCDDSGAASAVISESIDEKATVGFHDDVSTLPEQFSTCTICLRDGIRDDTSLDAERSETISCIKGTFDRGSRRGRFASVLMIRWLASRVDRAATTWFTLKDGFSGTYGLGQAINTHAL
jgi:hypothetical protein